MYERISQFGSNALLLEWQQTITDEIIDEITFYAQALMSKNILGVIDIVPAYASLTIFYNSTQLKQHTLIPLIDNINFIKTKTETQTTWTIHVKYDQGTSDDMIALMEYTGLDRQKIVDYHSKSVYKVCFLGFLPGFLYLSGLHSTLCMPRKKVPALNVPMGSVAIGGCQTGIYPIDSPGGWHVLGHTDFSFIQLYEPPYCRIHPGDFIRFEPI